MYFANDENGIRVNINSATVEHRYFCPACKNQMIIKRGRIITPHFAHKTKGPCDHWYTGKMSPWHRKMQNKFPLDMQEITLWNDDQTEFHVADVLVGNEGMGLVFEFQHSAIPVDTFICRTKFYMDLGYSVVWIFDYQNCDYPKCIYYEDAPFSERIKHVLWPGRDRVRFFDCETMRSFIEDCDNGAQNLSVLFNVNTGRGREYLCEYQDGYQSYKWEYVDPLAKEAYYIRPYFNTTESLSDFWAVFFTEEEIDERIQKIVAKYIDVTEM